LRTNHKPKIKGTDHGLWRRIHYVPYSATITTADAILNYREDYLVPELAGIFNWMLDGWRAYLAAGRKLNPPPCVQEGVAQYKKESDITGKWVAAAVYPNPGAGRIPLKAIYSAYREWFADEMGDKGHVASQTLAKSLDEAGYTRINSRGFTYYEGLALAPRDLGLELGAPLKSRQNVTQVSNIPGISSIRVNLEKTGNVTQAGNIKEGPLISLIPTATPVKPWSHHPLEGRAA
jgi:hypothetical protein